MASRRVVLSSSAVSDLELLAGEPPPRSDATCARLGRRLDPIGTTIAIGVLWLFVASGVATLLLLAIVGTHPAQPASPAVSAAFFAAFGLAWVPFVLWVVRRRRSARAIVRDGALAPARLEEHAAVFDADGREQRAIFSAPKRRLAGGAAPAVVYLAGDARCLVVLPDGSTARAQIATGLIIDAAGGRATISLGRGRTERAVAWILALVLAQLAYIAARVTFFQKPSELRCDRAADRCTLSGSDIFGSAWDVTFPASAMNGSSVEDRGSSEKAWVVERSTGGRLELGNPTGRGVQQDVYRRASEALEAFIHDRARPALELRFEALGGPTGAVWILSAALVIYILAGLLHGWRTTLTIDRFAGELTILRRPALWPPARRVLPLSSVARAETQPGGLWLVFSYLPTVTLKLVGGDGKVLFRRRQTAADETRRQAAAINQLLQK